VKRGEQPGRGDGVGDGARLMQQLGSRGHLIDRHTLTQGDDEDLGSLGIQAYPLPAVMLLFTLPSQHNQ
jgi:hypothetical protein